MSGTVESPATTAPPVIWEAGLEALVHLSGALAAGSGVDLTPWLEAAEAAADPLEVEETLLQSYLFLGFPVALNGLAAWRRVSGREAPAELGAGATPDDWAARGEVTCRAVYGGAYDALRDNIGAMKPEMERWMLVEGYGKVLSRPGMTLGRRECCIVAILAVLDVPVQLRSHLRGALRCGAEVAVLERTLDAVARFQSEGARSRALETLEVVRRGRAADGGR